MFIEGIKAIINLLKLKKDAKKTDLEIKKLEKETKENVIVPATMEDIKNYDPKIRKISESIITERTQLDDGSYKMIIIARTKRHPVVKVVCKAIFIFLFLVGLFTSLLLIYIEIFLRK